MYVLPFSRICFYVRYGQEKLLIKKMMLDIKADIKCCTGMEWRNPHNTKTVFARFPVPFLKCSLVLVLVLVLHGFPFLKPFYPWLTDETEFTVEHDYDSTIVSWVSVVGCLPVPHGQHSAIALINGHNGKPILQKVTPSHY